MQQPTLLKLARSFVARPSSNVFLKMHLPYLIWGLCIFWLISIPGDNLPDLDDQWDWLQIDKIVHIILFFILSILLFRAFSNSSVDDSASISTAFTLLIILILFGGSSEIYQNYFVLDRTASLKDFLSNTVGAILGWVGWMLVAGFSLQDEPR